MDERLKNLADNLDNMKIGLDEPFRFSCRQCGKCCINREDILLSPKDLFGAAKELSLTTMEFFEQYCETYIGNDSRLVIVRLKPRGSIKRCPLLKDRKCSIHKAKPTVCAMYPIGRAITFPNESRNIPNISSENVIYIQNPVDCGKDEVHTVREWFSEFGIPVEDSFFIEWQKTFMMLHEIIALAEKNFKEEETLKAVWNAIFAKLYINYDMEQEFFPQFLKNRDTLLAVLRFIPQYYNRGKQND